MIITILYQNWLCFSYLNFRIPPWYGTISNFDSINFSSVSVVRKFFKCQRHGNKGKRMYHTSLRFFFLQKSIIAMQWIFGTKTFNFIYVVYESHFLLCLFDFFQISKFLSFFKFSTLIHKILASWEMND